MRVSIRLLLRLAVSVLSRASTETPSTLASAGRWVGRWVGGRREGSGAIAGGHHALGDDDLLGEYGLVRAGPLAKSGQAFTEAALWKCCRTWYALGMVEKFLR
jgi:hypothetical protein